MDISGGKFSCGPVCFNLEYRDIDGGAPHGQGAGGHGGTHADQGVCVQVLATVDGTEREVLRFACFDNHPHYQYDPGNTNVRVMLDPTVTGNPLRWTMTQLRKKLPAMLGRAAFRAAVGGPCCVGGWLLSVICAFAFDEPRAAQCALVFLALTFALMLFAAIAEMIANHKPPVRHGFEVIVRDLDEPM